MNLPMNRCFLWCLLWNWHFLHLKIWWLTFGLFSGASAGFRGTSYCWCFRNLNVTFRAKTIVGEKMQWKGSNQWWSATVEGSLMCIHVYIRLSCILNFFHERAHLEKNMSTWLTNKCSIVPPTKQGSLHYQPKQCTIIGNPPNMGNSMTPEQTWLDHIFESKSRSGDHGVICTTPDLRGFENESKSRLLWNSEGQVDLWYQDISK